MDNSDTSSIHLSMPPLYIRDLFQFLSRAKIEKELRLVSRSLNTIVINCPSSKLPKKCFEYLGESTQLPSILRVDGSSFKRRQGDTDPDGYDVDQHCFDSTPWQRLKYHSPTEEEGGCCMELR